MLGLRDSGKLMERCREAKVLFVPGVAFSPSGEEIPWVRACYSLASPQDMDTALQRFAHLIRSSASDEDD